MLASRPPLGWNSWNTFGEHISDALIREMADYMTDKGWRDAGYEYLVIDDCWSLRDRDENGLLVPDPEKFPHGMKDLADYVHSKGLKFGMYSCAGVMTCASYPSSYDHEFVDAQTFGNQLVDPCFELILGHAVIIHLILIRTVCRQIWSVHPCYGNELGDGNGGEV